MDPTSRDMFKEDEDSVKFLQDETVQQKLATALTLQEVKVAEYDAIYYPGGCVYSVLNQERQPTILRSGMVP